MTNKRSALLKAAKKAQKNSYSPYSKFRVGAALLTDKGKIVSGCNVENASYGATICAERVAILKAVSEGAKSIKEMMVFTQSDPASPPCGLCCQMMAEFGGREMIVHLANQKGRISSSRFKEYFPRAFDPKFLKS
jgi:cytidine deaminase